MSPRITGYALRELARPFGFFVLVFTAVVWLTQSLDVIETIVNSGRGASVFLSFSALLLPTVLSIVLPISAFAATLYAVNKLFVDSEITAMVAAGMSPIGLARPVALFGALCAVAMAVCTIYVAPLATREMRDRVHELRADVAGALIFEGRFLHPADGLTVYVRENRGGGELRGVFVHDRRDPAAEVTYTASRAALLRVGDDPRLMMFDGAAQRVDPETGALSLLNFDQLAFDLGQFIEAAAARSPKPSELDLIQLVAPEAADLRGSQPGRLIAEGHERLSAPLYGFALPLVGLATMLSGGFTRRGYGRRVAAAVVLGVGLRVAGIAAKSLATGMGELWPLLYAPPIVGAIAALWSLTRGGAVRGGVAEYGGFGRGATS